MPFVANILTIDNVHIQDVSVVPKIFIYEIHKMQILLRPISIFFWVKLFRIRGRLSVFLVNLL